MPSGVRTLREWLEYLDSHNGRLARVRQNNALESEYDLIAVLPPGRTIFTVGDLREVVVLLPSKE